MHKPTLIGATLVLALLAPTARDLRATGSTADIVFDGTRSTGTVPSPRSPRHHASSRSPVSRCSMPSTRSAEFEPYRVDRLRRRPSDRQRPRPRTPHTMCSSPSTRRDRDLRCGARASLGARPLASFAAARRRRPRHARRSCCGGDGWVGRSPVSTPVLRATLPGRYQKTPRTTPLRHLPIFNTPSRWRC